VNIPKRMHRERRVLFIALAFGASFPFAAAQKKTR